MMYKQMTTPPQVTKHLYYCVQYVTITLYFFSKFTRQ